MTDWNNMPKHIIASDLGFTFLMMPFSIFILKNSSNLSNMTSAISDMRIFFSGSCLTSSIATLKMLKSSSERCKMPKNEILRYSSIPSSYLKKEKFMNISIGEMSYAFKFEFSIFHL